MAKLTEIQLGMLCQVKTKCVGSAQGRCVRGVTLEHQPAPFLSPLLLSTSPGSRHCCTATLLQIFPRHVLETMSIIGGAMGAQDLAGMARSHNNVSVLFMDICGAFDVWQLQAGRWRACAQCCADYTKPLPLLGSPGFTDMSNWVPPQAVMPFVNE